MDEIGLIALIGLADEKIAIVEEAMAPTDN